MPKTKDAFAMRDVISKILAYETKLSQVQKKYGGKSDIDIESEEEKGTKVYFRIPLELRTTKEENHHEE